MTISAKAIKTMRIVKQALGMFKTQFNEALITVI